MLHLLHIDGGTARPMSLEELAAGQPETGYLWLDLEAPTEDEARILGDAGLHLPEMVIEDLLEDDHMPKVDVVDDLLALTVHAMDLEHAAAELTTRELDLVLTPRMVITHHVRPIVSVRHVADRLRRRGGARGLDRPVLLMHRILDVMSDVFVSFIAHMDKRLDLIEEDILSDPTETTRREIYALQRDVIQVRRAVVPQAEVLRRLGRTPTAAVGEDDLKLFNDIHDHLYRMAELSESYRQLLDSALDSYQSSVDADLNQMLKVLTLINAVLLPIGVLAGIYGMNFANMPELQWENGYFWLLGIFGLITTFQVVMFRRAGWIGGRAERAVRARRAALPNVLEIPLLGSVLKVPVVTAKVAGRTFAGIFRQTWGG